MPLGMLGKYERLDVLGHGASGIVYLARDTLLRRQVALKEIAAQGEEKQRFLEEARVLDRLRHPNIVRVNNVDTIGGKVVIDMEYVAGRNLQEILRDVGGSLPVPEAVSIAAQVCDGLSFAHQNHTVHRDVKPANILVSPEGQVKLVDFGLAEVLGTNSYAGGAGTYAYMAPEDFEEDERSDAQSDLWAVGVILYEMLTGRRPFSVAKPKDPFAWKRAVSEDAVAPPSAFLPGLPRELDAICLKALSRDKARRYQTAGEMSSDLMKVMGSSPGVSPLAAPNLPEARGSSNARPVPERDWPLVNPPASGRRGGRFGAPLEQAPNGAGTTITPRLLIGASDIDTFLQAAPGRWEDAREALVSGELVQWLESIGEQPLAMVATQIRAQEGEDHDAYLRDFLYRAGLDTQDLARREAEVGSTLLRAGAAVEAAAALRRAIRLDPTHSSYFLLLGRALKSRQDSVAAALALQEGLVYHPRDRALRRDLKAIGGARMELSRRSLDFGQARPGQSRQGRLVIRNLGDGVLQGRVASLPGWLRVTPMTFSTRHRQPLELVADTSHLLPNPGEYSDTLILESNDGRAEIGVRIGLLSAFPGFHEIFQWYMPLLLLCLLPVLLGEVATWRSHSIGHTLPLYPAGMIASGLLFISFFLVSILANVGWRERAVAGAGILFAPFGVASFVSLMGTSPGRSGEAWPVIVETALVAGAVIGFQIAATLRTPGSWGRWQVWGGIIALASCLVSAILWHAGILARVQ
ncbi:MAG TPA: serine/threonine-protein kinase [Capsulimonadaceae bacterium]|nr:serine/threonine-protein kinase [Capsulimonadaceae bacterium]